MKYEGSAGRAVHVQGDWKLFKLGPGGFVFYAKNCTRVQKISEIEETFVNNWLVR